MADGAGLENRYRETYRGFKSHVLRHMWLTPLNAGWREVVPLPQTLSALIFGVLPA